MAGSCSPTTATTWCARSHGRRDHACRGDLGPAGDTGDGGPATEAQLDARTDGGAPRRRVPGRRPRQQRGAPGLTAGVITRVAGTYGPAGATPGTAARPPRPSSTHPDRVTVLPGGGFLFADAGNNVVCQGLTGA